MEHAGPRRFSSHPILQGLRSLQKVLGREVSGSTVLLERSSWPAWKVGRARCYHQAEETRVGPKVGNGCTLDIFWRQIAACDDNLMVRTGETVSLLVSGWSGYRHSCDV